MAAREITGSAAIREALVEEMERDESVFLLGEDIRYSVWGITGGLDEKFGKHRVRHTPIAENGFCGMAVGAAMTGMRPVVEIMYGDFLLVAMDAICNQAAKYRFMCGGGEFRVPVVFRIAGSGIGSGGGPQHAQYLESVVTRFPGLKVVEPADPYEAKGLLKAAIRDDNPVVFFEQKIFYQLKGNVPKEEYVLPLGKAAVVREGSDVTIASFGVAVSKCLDAAGRLAEQGVQAEVMSLRSLYPLDEEAIIASVMKTGRLFIVEDGCKAGGIGAEVAAVVSERAIEYLNAPIIRIAGLDALLPGSRTGETMLVPSVDQICDAVLRVAR